ncbi:MAG: peroxiredoxin family protein [Alteromonadaceae bacterium]|jgi:peroxiredoxin
MSHVTKSIFVTSVLVVLLSLTLFSSLSFAKSVSINVGPSVGDKAPSLTVIDKNKTAVNIDDLTAEKGLIILFFRSADWCPFCKKHLVELQGYADKFKALGYGIAAISYDNTEILNSFIQAHNLTYPLLSDQSAATVKAYGVLNKDYKIGDDNYGIPYPGVVIINPAGKIDHKYFFKGYRKRVKFVELYEQLNAVKKV